MVGLYAFFTFRAYQIARRDNIPRNATLLRHRRDPGFYLFLSSFAMAIFCILVRCLYRVVELSKGWGDPLAHNQVLFMVFEATFVFIACFGLAIFHPCARCETLFDTPGAGVHGRVLVVAARRIKPRIMRYWRLEKPTARPQGETDTELGPPPLMSNARFDGADDGLSGLTLPPDYIEMDELHAVPSPAAAEVSANKPRGTIRDTLNQC